MITSGTRKGDEHSSSSGDEDVQVVEKHSRTPQAKNLVEHSKRVYYSLSSSPSDEEKAMEKDTIAEVVQEINEFHESMNEQDRHAPLPSEHATIPRLVQTEQSVIQKDCSLEALPTVIDLQKRHPLDDDTSFFFRGHNISEGVKRTAAMYDSTDARQQAKSKRRHHNLDIGELGDEKPADKLKSQSDVDNVLDLRPEEDAKEHVMEQATPIKYDAMYDPEFAKLLARYTTRGSVQPSYHLQQEQVKPMLELKSVNCPVTNDLNVSAHIHKDEKVMTLHFTCALSESFGDIKDALQRQLRRHFTLMYRETPILSSLTTPESLGIAKGSTIDAFDALALEAFKLLQEREQTGRRELLEAEQLASSSAQLGEDLGVSEDDQDASCPEHANTHVWTMRIRVNAKQTESIQINPDNVVSRLLHLVLKKIGRCESLAVLTWDGIALPGDAIIRDADLEDGDQLELHFKQPQSS